MKQEVGAVPLSGPYLGEREEELVLEVMRSGRLSLGPCEPSGAPRYSAPSASHESSMRRRPCRSAIARSSSSSHG